MLIEATFKTSFTKTPPKICLSTSLSSAEFILDMAESKISIDLDTTNSKETIKIEFLNKDYDDDNVIELVELFVDGINLQHFILLGVFRPNYNPDWLATQKVKPPETFCPGTEMRLNGEWTYNIDFPVWKHIMNYWVKDERYTKYSNYATKT